MGLFRGTSSAEELVPLLRRSAAFSKSGTYRVWRARHKQLPGVQCHSLLGFLARHRGGTRLPMLVCRRKPTPVELACRELCEQQRGLAQSSGSSLQALSAYASLSQAPGDRCCQRCCPCAGTAVARRELAVHSCPAKLADPFLPCPISWHTSLFQNQMSHLSSLSCP